MKLSTLALWMAAGIFAVGTARGALLDVNLPGASWESGWQNLTAANYPGYPTFMTSSSPWPAPIAATSGTGNLTLNKVSGRGFPSDGGGIYIGTPTTGTGTFAISSPLNGAITGLETVVFQLDIDGIGASWTNVLSGVNLGYNGGAQALTPGITSLLGQQSSGEVFGQPATRYQVLFQWDLTGLGATSFNIGWTAQAHSLGYEFQVVQGDTMSAVPEPSAAALALAGGLAAGAIRRRLRR